MTRFFPLSWKDFAVLAFSYTVAVSLLIGCSSGVKQVGTLGWKVEVVAGTEQITLPRQPYSKPVEIIVKDSAGQPVVDAAMEFRLIDRSALGETEIRTEDLMKAWESESARLTSTNPAVRSAAAAAANATRTSGSKAEEAIEDRVGRIDQFDQRTSKEGKARVWVIAATSFEKTIVVLAKAGSDASIDGSFSYALLKTSNFTQGARLTLSTTNANSEKAGSEFDIFITVIDTEGRVVTSFKDTRTIKIEATPQTSWAGFKPNFPNGEFQCKFSGGMCVVPKGPYVLTAPEDLAVKLSIVSSTISPLETSIQVKSSGEKTYLVAKSHPGALRSDSTAYSEIKKPAGTATSLTAAWVDAAGNYIEDATNVTWSIDNSQLLIGNNFSGNPTTVEFKPTKTGLGSLTMSADGKTNKAPIALNIPAGEFVQWGVRVGGVAENPEMVAGQCLSVDIYAADENLNTNSDVNEVNYPVTLTIENGELAPYVAQRAYFEGAGVGQNERNMTITLKNGDSSAVEKVCLFDAKTTIQPKVKVVSGTTATKYKTFTGLSSPIKVNKGAPSRLGLVFGGTEKHVCWTYNTNEFTNVNDPCIVDEVARAPVAPSTVSQDPTSVTLKPVLFDAAGNVVATASTTWKQLQGGAQLSVGASAFALDSANDSLNVASGGNFSLKLDKIVDGSVLNVLSGSLNSGQFPSISAENARNISYSFIITPRAPTKVRVEPCVGSTCSPVESLKTTDAFGVRLKFTDADNNPVTSYVKRNTGDGYPRKQLYRNDKPTGSLHMELVETAPGALLTYCYKTNAAEGCSKYRDTFDCAEQNVPDASCQIYNSSVDNNLSLYSHEAAKPVRQGMSENGSVTSNKVDYEFNLISTTPTDGDVFLISPSANKYFQSPKTLNAQSITGKVLNLNIGSTIIPSLTIESAPFAVAPGAPWRYRAVDPNNTNAEYTLSGTKILLQQTSKSSYATTKALQMLAYDKYKNAINTPQSFDYKWESTSSTCSDPTNTSDNNVTSPFVTLENGNPVRATLASDKTIAAGSAMVYLTSPCAIKGRVKLIPNSNSYDANFLNFNSGVNQYLPEIEYIGDVEHHYWVDAVPVTSITDPNGPQGATRILPASGTTGPGAVVAGSSFFIRMIPMVSNNSSHVAAYTGWKKLFLSTQQGSSWAGNNGAILPSKTGNTYVCNFVLYPNLVPGYSTTSKQDVPVCVIKGPQRFITAGTSCDSSENELRESDGTTPYLYLGQKVCESKNGFKVGTANPGNLSKNIIDIQDKTAQSNIINEDPNNSLKLEVTPSAAFKMVLANKCGGPSEGAKLWEEEQNGLFRTDKKVDVFTDNNSSDTDKRWYQLVTDDSVAMVPTFVDAQGNWIKDTRVNTTGGVSITTPMGRSAYLSTSSTPKSVDFVTVPQNFTCGEHDRITITPQSATANDFYAAKLKANLDKIVVSKTENATSFTETVALAVKPGRPATASVTARRVIITGGNTFLQEDVSGATSTTNIKPGQCAKVIISAQDGKGNIIYENPDTVSVNLHVKDYYSNTSSEKLFQPGGLFKVATSDTKLTPVMNIDVGYLPHDDSTNMGFAAAAFAPSDPFEPDASITYMGHEKIPGQMFTDGTISGLNRYLCVFDATPGGGNKPYVHVQIKGGTGNNTYTIAGESNKFTIDAHPTANAFVDIRDGGNTRLCPIPNSSTDTTKLNLPRRTKMGTAYQFIFDTGSTSDQCSTLAVSSSAAEFKTVITDPAGNDLTGFTPTTVLTEAGNPTSNSTHVITNSSPNWNLKSKSNLGTLENGLQRAGPISITINATGPSSLTRSVVFTALSKIPKSFDVFITGSAISGTQQVNADSAFGLSFIPKDEFGNNINDPQYAYNFATLLTYSGVDPDAPNVGSNAMGVATKPATLFLNASSFVFDPVASRWLASSPVNALHFKKIGTTTLSATGSFTKTGATTQSAPAKTLNVVVLSGASNSTVITQDDPPTYTALFPDSTNTNNGLTARSSTDPFFFRTGSFDQFGNTVTNTATPSVTCGPTGQTVVNCSAVAADPGKLSVATNKSGSFELLANIAGIATPKYNFVVSAGAPSRVRIVPKGFTINSSTALTAGDTKQFNIELVDSFNNVTDAQNGNWTITWSVGENYPAIPLGGEKVSFASYPAACNFQAGKCALDYSVTFKGAAANNIDGAIVVTAVNGAQTLQGSLALKTNPSTLSFYNVKKVGSTAIEARRDNNSAGKFSVTVTAHDIYGNLVNVTENKSLKLQIVRPDGGKTFFPDGAQAEATRAGNGLIQWGSLSDTALVSATTDTASGQTRNADIISTLPTGQSTLTINNLAFDDPGDYKILATDQNNIATPLTRSDTITLQANLNSLKDFYLDLPSALTMTAGQSATVRVVARTFYNLPLRGLDKLLSNNETGKTYQFIWNTISNTSEFGLAAQLPETGSTLPSTLTFVDGIATANITLQKVNPTAGQTSKDITTAFALKGKQTISGVHTLTSSSKPAASTVVINPAALASYKVDVTGLTTTPTATIDSRFTVTVTALDAFGNLRPGETGLNLVAERSSDNGLVGSSSTVGSLMKPQGSGNRFADGFDSAFSANEINLSNGQWSHTGLVYLVPQTVKFTLSGAAVAVDSTNNNNTSGGFITFAPALGTVHSYSIAIKTGTTDLSTTGQYRTHGNTPIIVTARDYMGNPVPNIQTPLNSQTYTFVGANSLTSPTTEAPVYPTSKTFNASGIWEPSIEFKATQSFLAGGLTITDNHTVSAQAAARTGSNVAPFTVYSRHKDYTIDAGGASVDWNVGTPTQLKITARGYDNLPVREFDTVLNGYTFAWSGTGFANAPSGTQPTFGDNSTKTGKQFAFNNAVAFVNITAVKAETIAASHVALTDNSGGSNKSGTLTGTINVKPGALNKYTLTSNQSTRNADSAADGLFTLTVLPMDSYNNPTKGEVGLAITTVGGSKTKTILKSTTAGFNSQAVDLSTGLDASSGAKIINNVYYDVPDSNITFTLTGTAVAPANITNTSAMTFNATEKSIVGYNLTLGSSQTAGSAFNVTLAPRDIAGNTLTSLATAAELTALQAKRFKLSGPSNALSGATPTPAVSASKTINPNFTNGLVGTVSVTLVRAETLAAGTFVFEDDATTPRTGANTAAITVVGAAPTALHAANLPAVRAAQQFDVVAYLKDSYLNNSFTGCGTPTANGLYAVIGWQNAAGTFSEVPADVTPSGPFTTTTGAAPLVQNSANSNVTSTSTVGPDSANGDQMKLRVTLYKKGQNRVRLLACGRELPLTVDVSETATATMARLSSSATRPTTSVAVTEVECKHSGADLTSAQVICPTVYSYFWDTYGNTFADGTGQCAWSGAKAGTDPTTLPSAITGSSPSLQVTHTGPVNSNITCTGPNALTQSLLLYGGISRWAAEVVPNAGIAAVPFSSTTDGDLTNKNAAVGTAMIVKNIAAQMYKGTGNTLVAYATAAGTSHTITINKSDFSGTGVANIPNTLTANLSTAGVTQTSDLFDLNFSTSYDDRFLILTMRGLPAKIDNITINSGAAASIAFNGGTSANTTPMAGASFNEIIVVKDSAGNNANCTSINVVASGSANNSLGNAGTIPGTSANFAYNTVVALTNDSGSPGRFTVPMQFFRAGSVTLTFTTNGTLCGSVQTLQQSYSVLPKTDTGMLARLSTDGTTPPTTHLENLVCPLGTGLNISCPTVYLHAWDAYGNYLSNSTCASWSWEHYDLVSGATGTSETPALTSGAVRSQSLAITSPDPAKGFLDGRLSCDRGNTTIHRSGTTSLDANNTGVIQTVVTGGLKSLVVTTNPSGPTISSVVAASSNVSITQIKAMWRKVGVEQAKSDFVTNVGETINFSTSSLGSVTGETARTLTSGSSPIMSSTTLSCAFTADGICKTPANTATTATVPMTFALVESAGRKVTVNLRGKTQDITVTTVNPANAANVTLAVKVGGTATSSLTVRQEFTVEATVRDSFGNFTTKKATDGTSCAGSDASATLNHTTPSAAATNLGTSATPTAPTYSNGGLYSFSIPNTTVTLAGTKTVSVTACGVSATTSALTFTPGALWRIVLTDAASSTTTQLAEKRCPLQTTGSGVNCPTIYAYYFDQDDNTVSGQNCNWSYAHNSNSLTNYGAQLTTPTLSSNGNSTTSTTITHSDFIDGVLTCTAVSNSSITRTMQLYGGIAKVDLTWTASSRDAGGTSTPTPNGTNLTAADSNMVFASGAGIKLLGPVKGNNTNVPDAGTALPITFTTTAPSNNGTSALPTNTTACNFQTTQGVCSDQPYSFNFRTANVGATNYQATVSVRGKTATISNIVVNPANAHALVLAAKVGSTAVTSVTTDDTFDVFAQVNDTYGNATDLGTSYVACPAPATNNTSVDTTGVVFNSSKSGATADNTLTPTTAAARVPAKVASTVGQYKYTGFQLTGIQSTGSDANSTLKFGLCGIATTATGSSLALVVKPGKPKEAFLNTSNAASRTSMGNTLCSLNASGAGATCGPIYAHFYDANQNLITSANGGQCSSWSSTNIPAGTPAGLTNPTITTTASNSQTFTSTGAFSINLTCNNTTSGFTAPSVKLYGGIAQLALTWTAKTLNSSNTSVSTANASTVDAQSENLIIDTITYKTYDDTGALVTLQQGTTTEALNISTTSSAGATNINPLNPTNGNATCSMPAGVCTTASAGAMSNNVYKLTLNKAGEVDRSITVSMRGITASITGLTVNPGAMAVGRRVNSIASSAVVDQAVTGGAIELYDDYNNRTQKNCTTLALAYEYSSDGGTSFAAASVAAGGNTLSPDGTAPVLAGTATALSVNATVTGRYDLPTASSSALKFVKPGVYRITPTVCGQTLATHNITVSEGAAARVKLFASTPANPFSATADTGPIECPHTTASATGTAGMAISCPAINAYFFDSRGNRLTNETCNTWDFVKHANSNDSQTPSFANSATSSTTLTATDWIDGTLRCNKGGAAGSDLAPQLSIFGGTESISASFNTTTPTAGNDNVTLNSLTIRQRKQGSTVVVATARTNETVVVTTTATQAPTGSPKAVLTTGFTGTTEKTFQCNSAASTGVCTAGAAPVLSLTKVQANTEVTLTLRNKPVTTVFAIGAGAASTATLTLGTASPWTAGTAYSAHFAPLDTFSNPTTNGCVTLTGSGAATSPSTQSAAYGAVGAWDGSRYPITGISLYAADTTARALTYTCNGGISATQNIVVNTGTKTKVAIGQANSKPTFANASNSEEIKCTLASNVNSNTNLNCPTLYAWGYDNWGNSTADNTCQWQKADWTSGSFGTPSNLEETNTSATYSLSASGVLNARINCSGLTSLNTNNIYGGVSRISMILGQSNTASASNGVTTYTTSAAAIQAAPSNIVVSQLTAYSAREGTEVGVPGIQLANMNLDVTVINVQNQADYVLPVEQKTCTFDATTSECSQSMTFTFKKVHPTAGTRPLITVTFKGKESKVNVSPISAGNGATLNVTGWPATTAGDTANYHPIGTAFTATGQVLDQYGNNAIFTPTGTACSGTIVATGFESGVYANTITTPSVTAETGTYSITANILKAATHTVTLAACGLSSQQTLRTKAGTFDRAMITTTNITPTAYNCTSGDVCDVTIPTCTAATRAQCGPFYVWKYDQGGNLISNTPSDCGSSMNGISLTKTGDSDNITLATPSATSFSVQSATIGKHSSGTIQCTISNTITKGTRINFKAPTLVKPKLTCYPWGIDNAGIPEALCALENTTGYTIASVNFKRCDQNNTADTNCYENYSPTNEDMNNYSVSSHCFNLVSQEAGTSGFSGHKCSLIISGVSGKETPPIWVEAVSPDSDKVIFGRTNPSRIPSLTATSQSFANTTKTCTGGVTYSASEVAACDILKAGKLDSQIGMYLDGIGSPRCTAESSKGQANGYPTRRFTVKLTANLDPAKFNSNTTTYLTDIDAGDGVTVDTTTSYTTCDADQDLASNGTCDVRIETTRPYFEGAFKLTTHDSKYYVFRTGEAPRCTGNNQDAN